MAVVVFCPEKREAARRSGIGSSVRAFLVVFLEGGEAAPKSGGNSAQKTDSCFFSFLEGGRCWIGVPFSGKLDSEMEFRCGSA